MTAIALRSSSPLSANASSASSQPTASKKASVRTEKPQKSSTMRRQRSDRSRLKSLSNDMTAIEYLMIRHGQLECGPGARPIVPRCMTALPENLTEFLESLLPQGY